MNLTVLLAACLLAYLGVMYALAFWVRRRVDDVEDFLVAGRRLPLPMAWATLLATWFGAGTLLTATDEIRNEGVQRAALDPLGAGVCLLLAGLFFAVPLWNMGLLTLSDFFRRRYGPMAELISALIMVPSYFGWVAAQFVALAGMLEVYFGIDLAIGIPLVAAVSTGYTLLGGMWAVTITDAVQIVLVIVGLLILAVVSLAELGQGEVSAGLARLWHETSPEALEPIPLDSWRAMVGWLGVFLIGALGNLPGQDLMQRVFSARSAQVARRACLLAGGAYLLLGLAPILLGLAARLLVPVDVERSILPAMVRAFLSPGVAVVFTLVLTSAVMSTIDSALLSPASVLAQNVFARFTAGRIHPLLLNRLAVLLVATASLALAFAGQSAYELLEDAYEIPLVGLLVPLTMGIYRRRVHAASAIASMLTGMGLWLWHYYAGWDGFLEPWAESLGLYVPFGVTGALCSLVVFLAVGRLAKWPGDA